MLQGDSIDELFNVIKREYIIQCLSEYQNAIEFLNDWQNSMFTLSRQEYIMLPAVLADIRRIYNQWKKEYYPNVVGNKF